MASQRLLRAARRALLSIALAPVPALPWPAGAEVVVDGSSARTSIQVMSGEFLFEFAAPVVEDQLPVTSFASALGATPPGPFPATARASQTAEVTSGPEGFQASADGDVFVRAPGVPDPPLSNLFATAETSFQLVFHVTERATASLTAQALGSSASGDAASIFCSLLDGTVVERRGATVSAAVQLEAGESCSVTALVVVQRNGNREFLNPGESEGRLRISVSVSELGPDDGTVFRWVGPAQGGFGEASHWQNENGGGGVPGFRSFEDADTAVVDGETALDLDLAGGGLSRALGARGVGGTRKTGRLAVRSTQILRPLGGTLLLDSLEPGIGERSLEVGGARLLLDQGGVAARHVVVGRGNDGELEVVGPDGFFTTLGRFGIGGDADGNVTIRDGAQVTSAETVLGEEDGSGFASVQGAGTLWQTGNLALGFADAAGVTIEGGARVESENAFVDCQISAGPDVPGCTGLDGDERAEATITGTGGGSPSSWALSGNLEIGARGKVTVADGAALEAFVVEIGTSGIDADCIAGLACLDVADGRVTANGVKVGTGGKGKLQIGPAGRVTAAFGVLAGSGDLSDGEIRVLGPSAEPQLVTTDTGLALGTALDARGVLSLESGAQASFAGTSLVGASHETSGLIELRDGSVLRVAGASASLELGHDAVGDVADASGEILFSDGRLELADTSLVVRRTGRVSGRGEIQGSGLAQSVGNDGVIGCGVAIRAIYFQGTNGVLECPQAAPPAAPQLSPFAATRFARAVRAKKPTPPPPPPPGPFVVDGDATLDGTLVLQFLNGFAPSLGDAFELLDVSGNVTGSFANVAVRGLAPGADFAEDFVDGRLTLTSLTDATPLPVVSVKAKPALRERRSKKGGKIKLTRRGDTSEALSVRYVLRGTARNGLDYEQLPGVVEIPARKRSAKIALRAFPDGVAEGVETFSLELVSGDGYQTSLFSKAEVAIDDEKPKKKKRR